MGEGPFLMAALPDNLTTASLPPQHLPERPLVDVILECLDDAKAEETVSVDITGKSSLADHMVVTSGRSQRHVGAVADQLISALRDNGFGKPRVEGLPHCDWVLVDAGDVIVHIFRPEVREFYNIEKMWQADFAADQH
jgi:ribosome-associated protein